VLNKSEGALAHWHCFPFTALQIVRSFVGSLVRSLVGWLVGCNPSTAAAAAVAWVLMISERLVDRSHCNRSYNDTVHQSGSRCNDDGDGDVDDDECGSLRSRSVSPNASSFDQLRHAASSYSVLYFRELTVNDAAQVQELDV
jgi:hypothetical protein